MKRKHGFKSFLRKSCYDEYNKEGGDQVKRIMMAAVLCFALLTLGGCQTARHTVTPGNVAVSGEEAPPAESGADASAAEPAAGGENVTPPADVAGDASVVPPPAGAVSGGSVASPPTASGPPPARAQSGAITSQQAQAAALREVQLTAGEVTFTKTQLEQDDGQWIYEVAFRTSAGRYEMDLDAQTGEVLASAFDQHDGSQAASGGVTIDDTSLIGQDKARQIALALVPGAGTEHIRLKLDYDDGRALYEGDIRYGGQEYEFELDAASGAVLKWEADETDDDDEDDEDEED